MRSVKLGEDGAALLAFIVKVGKLLMDSVVCSKVVVDTKVIVPFSVSAKLQQSLWLYIVK